MYYTKLLVLGLVFMTACTTPNRQESPIPTGVLSTSAEDETSAYRRAITALNNSQLEAAEMELKKLSINRPEFAGPWINLAIIDIKKNNFDGAHQNLSKALERNPKMHQALNARGYVELARGNVTKAAGDFRQAFFVKENYALAHYNYALVHDIYFQEMKVAVRHYKRYLELTNNQDKKTADWVVELERNLAKGTK